MFFSLAEKQKNRFYHDWPMRVIAIDTTRRHLYYSEPGSPLVEDAANTDNNNNNNNYEEHNQDSSLTRVRPSPHLIWRKKLKILSATIVAPDIGFVHDQTYVEQNLYQVEIVGEARPMSMGEVPPSGPLLCRCAGISSSHTCNNDGVKILRDPFHLAELYASMHTDDDAPQTSSAALNSPRLPAGGYFSRNRNKPITTRLRCCDEGVFRRVCFVLHTMLAKDGLMILPHGGLPPFDPRNGLSFAHVPMAVWQTFSMLEQVVCFIFTRVEVMNSVRASHNKSGSTVGAGALPTTTGGESVGVMCTDAYLCVTHNMMLIVDQNGSLLRWMHIDRIHTFAYNSRCGTPFAVCRSNTPQRDLLFTLQGPIYGDVARANYDGRMMMRRIHTILHVCHDALPPLHRASMKMVEVLDATYAEYVAHQSAMGQPLNLRSPPQEPLSCPLPKAQLAVVWQQMQDEVHPGEDGAAQDGGGHPEWERMLQTPVFGGDVAASSASVTASAPPTYPQREEARFRTQSKAPGLWWLEDQPQEDEQPTHPAGHDDVGVIVPAYTLDDLIRCSLAAVPRGSS